jgi:hypothetical protein
MVNAMFFGMALLLAVVAAYWLVGRATPRPAGSLAIGSLLASCAFAFLAYTPLLIHAADSVVPHLSRLMSNSASIAAATSVVAASFRMNLTPEEAGRRIRRRLVLAAALLTGMAGLFLSEVLIAPSGKRYALYLGLFVSYLSLALVDLMRQALRQSRSTRRGSVRFGLRLASAGCVLGLVYAGYKTSVLTALALGRPLVGRDGPKCSSLIAPPCVFSVTAPALAVLLIGVGLTLPALLYPISQSRRRQWEIRSFLALEPLWRDLADAMPHIVLRTPEDDGDMDHDPAFLLQRRVVEISDGLLELRPYRPQQVLEAAAQGVDTETRPGAASMEAALARAALAGLRVGRQPADVVTSEIFPRGGDLRAETEWLVAVADAYAQGDALGADRPGHGHLDHVGA